MSESKSNLKSKIAAGVAVVALSGFVPSPMVQNANAAVTTISISGSFAAGITITSTAAVDIGTIIASGSTGTAKINAAGVASGASATVIGGSAAGKIKGKFKSAKPIDIIVSGFGTLGNGATLDKVYFGKLAGPGTITGGAATLTASATATAITGTGTKTLDLGAGVSWTGGVPANGAFNKAVTITLQY